MSLGIALDGTLLTATWRDTPGSSGAARAGAWRSLVVPCDGTPRSIASALAEVAGSVSGARQVAFTLLRPLATSRTVSFPKMKRAELEGVLERDWARYAIGLRAEPHTVAARAQGAGAWRAAFAPTDTLEALHTGAREHRWELTDIRTTEDALAAAAHGALPTVSRMDDAIVVLCGASAATDVAHLRLGEPGSARQLLTRTSAEVVAFVKQAMSRSTGTAKVDLKRTARAATVIVVGDAERGETLARELGREGLNAQHARLADAATDSPAALLASSALLHPASLALEPPTARVTRQHRTRIATRTLVAATLLLVAGGLAIENYRLGNQLDRVASDRAAIAARVSDAVARRSRLESATDAAAALAEHEANASRASTALATIALVVPENASLSMLQVSGDSVNVDGDSDRSAEVYDALRGAPMLEGVRLAAPLRQERLADAEPVEHFSFAARIRQGPR